MLGVGVPRDLGQHAHKGMRGTLMHAALLSCNLAHTCQIHSCPHCACSTYAALPHWVHLICCTATLGAIDLLLLAFKVSDAKLLYSRAGCTCSRDSWTQSGQSTWWSWHAAGWRPLPWPCVRATRSPRRGAAAVLRFCCLTACVPVLACRPQHCHVSMHLWRS